MEGDYAHLLRYDGLDYLAAPRGDTQWVKNLRASGQGRLRVGRRMQALNPVELADDDKPRLLRAHMKKWKVEAGMLSQASVRTRPMRNYAG
jgi:hypothetical protein